MKKKIVVIKEVKEVYVVTWTTKNNVESRVFGE